MSCFVYLAVFVVLASIAQHGEGHRLHSSQSKHGITRVFYIAAVETFWDYAPSGYNNAKGIKLENDSDASVFTDRGDTTIGKVYKKVLYREYTDDTFTKQKPHPKHLGLLGPVIYGEVGDVISVTFKNNAKRPFSMHPHGTFYKKNAEGALYEDETSQADKKDDHVPPGGTYTYRWEVKPNHGPTKSDSNCLTWIYHSHVEPGKDINTGLIGPLITCKKDTFDSNGKRKDVDQDFYLLFSVFDENVSWFLDENIDKFCKKPTDAKNNKEKESFQEANKMHAINGMFYANLPDLSLCTYKTISWHLFGIGNEVDIHTAYFHGQTVDINSHRKDIASLLPATFVTATMRANNPGTWMVNCVVDDHYNAGMYALFNVSSCSRLASPEVSGKTRTYYITAEEVIWDYGPSGMNNFKGGELNASNSDSAVFFARGPHRIGGRYKKALYFEYTDSSFTVKKNASIHLGFLGPVIRAEVGDTIKVVFKNLASRNYSINAHGVFFNKSNEGALYKDFTSAKSDDIVQPNTTYVYTWTVPEESGPAKEDTQCVTWAYYSSLDPVKDTYSGLIGPLLTCRKGTLNGEGKQKNIDKEFIVMLMVSDESMSWYHEENKQMFCTDPAGITEDDDYLESNKMHGINGRLYANLQGLEMCNFDKVSWHLIGFGNEVDMHTIAFYGQTVVENHNRKDTVSLLPGSFTTATMTPDNTGEWALICKTTDHFSAGMQAKFKVNECGQPSTEIPEKKIRRYYIAAIETNWDYAPTGKDILGNTTLEESEHAKTFTINSNNRIGRVYKKAVYREFTDDTFTKEKKRTDREKHLGVLGPIVYAEVGDIIEIVFKNKASRDYSVHPHGVFNNKLNEGSDYMDGSDSNAKKDNRIKPNTKFVYRWSVPERSGPGTQDSRCLTWAYYSDVDSVKDANTGLVGPLVVCKRGTLTAEGKPKNVDKDFALLFTVMDENKSWYLEDNIRKYCNAADKNDEDFQESNKMHVINGYVFGNTPGLEMVNGDNITWYLLGLGNEVDMHTVHFHGQTFVQKCSSYHPEGMRGDVYDLFPGVFATVKMVPDSTGVWMLHCHVNDHMDAGMEARFVVKEKPTDVPTVVTTHKPPVGKAYKSVAQTSFVVIMAALVLTAV